MIKLVSFLGLSKKYLPAHRGQENLGGVSYPRSQEFESHQEPYVNLSFVFSSYQKIPLRSIENRNKDNEIRFS